MMRSLHKPRGYTLVELLVSISIFVVLSTVGLLSFQRNRANQQLSDSGERLASILKKAQGYTRSGRSAVTPSFDSVVPRAFGVSFSNSNPHGFYFYADLSSNFDDYCFNCSHGFSDDSLLENITFPNDVSISSIVLSGGPVLNPVPNRVDLALFLPTADVYAIYQDPNDPTTFIPYVPDVANNVNLSVTLQHAKTNRTQTIELIGGPLGGVVMVGDLMDGPPPPQPPPGGGPPPPSPIEP